MSLHKLWKDGYLITIDFITVYSRERIKIAEMKGVIM